MTDLEKIELAIRKVADNGHRSEDHTRFVIGSVLLELAEQIRDDERARKDWRDPFQMQQRSGE